MENLTMPQSAPPLLPGWQPDPRPDGAAEDLRLSDVAGMLRRHRSVILACLAATLVVAGTVAAWMAPRYRATATVRIYEKQPQTTLASMLLLTGNEVSTEMGMLQSRALAAQVAESLRMQVALRRPSRTMRQALLADIAVDTGALPASYRFDQGTDGTFAVRDDATGREVGRAAAGATVRLPGVRLTLAPGAAAQRRLVVDVSSLDDATADLVAHLTVERQARDMNIMAITYEGTDPELVRQVPNVLAARFLAERRNAQQGGQLGTVAFLKDQLQREEGRLRALEDSLRGYRQEHRVVSLTDQASSGVSQAASLRQQRDALAAEEAALAELLADAERATVSAGGIRSYRSLIAFPSLLRNQALSGLLISLARVEDSRADLLTRRSPTDPDLQALSTRVRELEQQIRAIALTYLQSIRGERASLTGALAREERELQAIPPAEVELARLERELKARGDIVGVLQTRLTEAEMSAAAEDPSVRLVDPAQLPTRPFSPRWPLVLVLATILGTSIGLVAAVVREYRDHSVRTRGDVELSARLPVLAFVARLDEYRPVRHRLLRALTERGLRRTLLLPATEPTDGDGVPAPLLDEYYGLDAQLRGAETEGATRVILFTSPLAGDGKTTNASAFATSLAERGVRTLLVDADLKRGVVHHAFGASREPGLVNVLQGSAKLGEALRYQSLGEGRALAWLPSGGPRPTPATELLGSPAFGLLLDELGRSFDTIVIDSPPLLLAPDATVMAAHADHVVMVVRAGVTPQDALEFAVERCRRAHVPLAGALLNDISFRRDASYDDSYRWMELRRSYYATPTGSVS